VSRYGLVAYGSSLDVIGPFAQTVEDLALLTDVISGHDPRDATSASQAPTRLLTSVRRGEGLSGLKIGLVREFFAEGMDAATRTSVTTAVEQLKTLGAEVREVSLPSLTYSIAAYYLIATAEASANLARYDGVRYGARVIEPGQSLKQMYRKTRSRGFGREVKQRIMLGTFALSSGYYDAYYAKAGKARELIRRELDGAFQAVDLLVSPTAPTTAFKIGEKSQDPLAMYLSDICTLAANLAGIPALSVPCGFDAGGLPVGLQLMAKPFAEDTLLRGAYAYEQATDWRRLSPLAL
jgi:aspartyl-tRNA(Asn)/glutamyl-tRNA(Gln) amidotransferase subunit A